MTLHDDGSGNLTTNVFSGRRVLLAEDEALITMVVKDMLEEMGFGTVECVSSLAAAMNSAQDRPPDIAVLDLHVSDGITLPVAELLAHRGIRSIFVTGDFDAPQTHAIDEQSVVMKPFAPTDLQTALRYALENPLVA